MNAASPVDMQCVLRATEVISDQDRGGNHLLNKLK